MSKNNTKLLIVILISVLFVFTGLYLSIKSNPQTKSSNSPAVLITAPPPAAYSTSTSQGSGPQPTTVASASGRIKAKVARVIDGDTIELTDKRRVRYIGVNTPETTDPRKPVECFGKEAAKVNKQLVEGQTIEMEKDVSETDKYGRLLRYVYADNVFINEFLVRQGYARIDTVPPDVKYSRLFLSAEREARENNRGLWKECR